MTEPLAGGAAGSPSDGRLRLGLGHDSHPFGPGEPLRLGGVDIAGAPRLHGHSDGDAALHAVADALLGAAALGDLGRLAPADERTPRGADSATLLGRALQEVLGAGWQPAGLDITITAGRPRLAGHLEAMRGCVAGLLGLPLDAVSVKASSGNLQGAEGEGRAISASAIVTLAEAPRPHTPGRR
jgi:2-C-methyl-D-erythritol 2,4-cyclodiphosphate synthase